MPYSLGWHLRHKNLVLIIKGGATLVQCKLEIFYLQESQEQFS